MHMSPENLNDDLVLVTECKEKNGLVVDRSIYKVKLTPDNLKLFWDKAKVYPTLFNVELQDSFEKFLSVFLYTDSAGNVEGKGLLWKMDNMVGMFYLTDIDPGNDALVHVSFFDGRIRGREQVTCDLIKHVFEHYKFRRLTAHIPLFAIEATHAFTRRIGFKQEGRKRQSSFFKNRWFDTMQYGILSEEVL